MTPEQLLAGACDMHVHSGPALVRRGLDHAELAQACARAGMRAAVIKDQHMPTAGAARLVEKYFSSANGKFNLFGSVVLGNAQGGLSPAVVEASLICGAKVVWMPVMSAKYHRERTALMTTAANAALPKPKRPLKYDPPISIVDEDGRLLPQVGDICRLVAEAGAVLATGHIDPKREIPPLLEEAVRQGVKKIVITHPEFFHDHTMEEMRAYTDAGFYVEHILTTLYSGKQTYDGLYELIQNNGERVIISSDMGQVGRPGPVEALAAFLAEMQKRGVSDDRLRQITSRNQRRLLDLEPLEEGAGP